MRLGSNFNNVEISIVSGMRCNQSFTNHSTPIKSPALESRSPLMDPVDSTQGRHGRVALRDHHNSQIHNNDHIANIPSNHSNIHNHSSSSNPIRSPGNPPIPKRNHPSNHTGLFNASTSGTSAAGQGKEWSELNIKICNYLVR